MIARSCVLGVVVLAVCATPASAGMVTAQTSWRVTGKDESTRVTAVRYEAGAGERNVVTVQRFGGVAVVDDVSGLVIGAGCVPVAPRTAHCQVADWLEVTASLGDGDDRFQAAEGSPVVNGGPGNDELSGHELSGGSGDDILRGWIVDGGPGADTITAGTVSYASATGRVHLDLDELALAGQSGEGDRIDPMARNVVGGPFADMLTGDEQDNQISGGGGADRIDGRAASDRIEGGNGADRLAGGGGADAVFGGRGADRLSGGEGDDQLAAGAADDWLSGGRGRDGLAGEDGDDLLRGGPGLDDLAGDGGTDVVHSRDGQAERGVACGGALAGAERGDVAVADTSDFVRACRRVRRPGAARPMITALWQDDQSRRRVFAEVGCSQDQRRGCRARLRLHTRGRRTRAKAVELRPGDFLEYVLLVPRSAYLAGTANCGRLAATVRLASRDATGRPRTQRRRIALVSGSRSCPEASRINLPAFSARFPGLTFARAALFR